MWKAFLKAMAAAAISGAAGAASAVSNTPDASLKQIGQSSLVGAAVGTSLFLAKSPLPSETVKKEAPTGGPPNA